MPTNRELDDNGFLLVRGCPISSFGIFDYGAGQLGLPGDPMRIVKVFRPESAVSDPAAIASFMNVPFIIDHTMLSGFDDDEDAEAPENKGLDGILTSNVYYDAPWMRGDLKVFSRKGQRFINSGKKDLSLGYSCDFEVKPGVWNGQAYEVIQTNMRGNHIALVDEGRVPGARVLDGLIFDHLSFDVVKPSDKEDEMAFKGSKKAMDNAVAQLKALLPALEQFLNEEGQEPEHNQGAAPAAGGGADVTKPEGGANPMAAAGGTGESSIPSGEGATPPTGSGDPAGAAPPSAEGAAPSNEGEGGGAAPAGGDISGLVTQVESVLAQIKAAISGGGAEGGAGTDEGMNEGEQVEDTVNGLAGTNPGEGAAVCADEGSGEGAGSGQGKASPGPSAGMHTEAGDAALRGFYADLALKDSFYNRVSKVVGAFDSKAMDARQVVAYGVKKIGIKCAKGTEQIALDAYLTGIEAAAKATKQRVQPYVGDSKASSDDMDAYLKGAK